MSSSQAPLRAVPTESKKRRKRERTNYLIKANPTWLHDLTLSSYRGAGAPRWWRLSTEWLWEPPYSELSPAELGALVRLVCMFTRSHSAYTEGAFETHKRELARYRLSDSILCNLCMKLPQVDISVITGSGEIKELCAKSLAERRGEGKER